MSNLLTSLAFIKANVDSGISIWDSLTRLTINVIREKSLTEVSSESFCKEFMEYYSINIPLHPMNTIIEKLIKMKVIDVDYGKWNINNSKMDEINIKTQNQVKFESLINEFRKYLEQEFDIEDDYDYAEKIFLGYINLHDSELLCYIETKSMMPEIVITNADMYMVGSFIEWLVNSNSSFLKTLEDILLANIHLNSIFIIEKERKLKLNRVFVYLDTRFILRLTGIEGKFRKEEYSHLLDILINNKCNLRIFLVHYNEVIEIFKDCVRWLENNKNYNPKYASRALRYFVEHNYKVSDVLSYQAQIDLIMTKYKIGIDDHNYNEDDLNQYTIDEKKLYEIIKMIYTENNAYSDNYNMEDMIWNDIKAISSIYRKRKGFNANSLENIKAVFITNNNALARAVREYNKSRNCSEKYNECVTDTYWGTAIWLNTAYNESTFYTKKLIADSIAITELNPKLKEKFLNNVEERKNKGEFSDKEYYLLREYHGVNKFLKDATYNDEEEYRDSLPEEILEHFRDEVKKPLEEIIANNDEQIQEKNNELLKYDQRTKKQLLMIDRISKRFSCVILVLFGLLLSIPSFVLTFQELQNNFIGIWVMRIISIFISIFFFIDGFARIVIGKKLYDYKRKDLLQKWNIDD
jgi:hypothetical protein